MKISQQKQGAVVILRPDGPLIASEAPQLAGTVSSAMASSLGRVALDMSGVPFVDSAGLEALLGLTEESAASGRPLKLCAEAKTVREILELTGLAAHFDHFDDTNSAVRSFL